MEIYLRSEICSLSGYLGLVIEGPSMHAEHIFSVASSGALVAHDVVEHVNGFAAIGTITDEFEALGGVWYARGQFCDIRRPSWHPPVEDLIMDLRRMYGDTSLADWGPDIPTHAPDDCYEDVFHEALKAATKAIRAEYSEDLDSLGRYLRDALHGMRSGVEKMRKRFPTALTANALFWNVSDAVQAIWHDLECEGQRYCLTYCDKTANAYLKMADW